MSDRIDFFTLERLAMAFTRARLTRLTVADLDLPSPCAGWDVRAVLAHLVGGNIRFAQALRGEPADWATRDSEPIATPLEEFDASAAQMAAAVAAISDPARPTLLSAGEPPASFAVGVHGADMLVHGWDLSIATGQDPTLDPDLCRVATEVIGRYPPSFWGPGRFFAPQVDTASTDPQVRLLALTGRDPQLRQARPEEAP